MHVFKICTVACLLIFHQDNAIMYDFFLIINATYSFFTMAGAKISDFIFKVIITKNQV